jgi:hypothetical protein
MLKENWKVPFLSLFIIMIVVIAWKVLLFINVFSDTNIWLGITPDILSILSIFILVNFQKNGGFSSKNKLKAIGLTMTAITWITILI